MKSRTAFVDEVALAREFATDDFVRKTTNSDVWISPYVGRVLYSDDQTGKVMVQWPWGAENEQPSELLRDASGVTFGPLLLDQLYSTVERAQHENSDADFKLAEKFRKSLSGSLSERVKAQYEHTRRVERISSLYEKKTLPIKRAVCLAFHHGLSDTEAYFKVCSKYASEFGSEPIRLTVSNFYGMAKRVAIYWKDSNRRYKVTKSERESGKLKCPRCGSSPLKPRVYRQGQKFLGCTGCGFAISPEDLV